MKTKAAVLYEANQPAVIEEIELEPPHRGEILVRMLAAGVCHSDLHVRDGRHRVVLVSNDGHRSDGR